MTRKKLENMSAAELRAELEASVREVRSLGVRSGAADAGTLVHDLRVHQVELEMQNRELQDTLVRLEEAKSRYADLYDFAPVGYCTLDPEGYLQELNLTAAALLHAPRAELVGRSFPNAAALRDASAFREHMRRCARERQRVTTELNLSGQSRGDCVVQLVSEPLADDDGTVTAYRTAIVDITGIKQLEGKLRLLSRTGEALAASLDYAATTELGARLAVPDLADLCIVDLERDGALERRVVQFADSQKQHALAEGFRGFGPRPGWRTPQEQVAASSEPIFFSELSTAIRSRLAYDDEHSQLLRAAGIRSMMVVPLRVRTRTFGALTLATAESERTFSSADVRLAQDFANQLAMAIENARLYGEAQRAIAARDATAAMVSHDLLSPLQVILGRVEQMLSLAPEPDRRKYGRAALESVLRSGQTMHRLIRDLLDVSRIEAGRFTVETARVPAGQLVVDALDAAQVQAAARAVRLESEMEGGGGFLVECDRHAIGRVLANLIGNAIKFSESGERVLVRIVDRNVEACFSVADNGRGIAAGEVPHVFDRFWHAESGSGAGLGLSIAKGIVEAHGGKIWLESELGRGTIICFTLPRDGAANASGATAAASTTHP